MQSNLIQKSGSSFDHILWWIVSFSLLLFTQFPSTNQLVLKGIVPFAFIVLVFKMGGIKIDNKGLILYIGLFAWGCLSLMYTVNMSMTLDYLERMLGNIIIWYIVIACVNRQDNIRSLFIPLFFIFIIHSYYGFTTPVEIADNQDFGRAMGLTSNANSLGFLMWYGIGVAAFLMITAKGMLYKILFLVFLGVFAFVLLKSGSRKSLAALLIFLTVFFFLLGKKRNYLLLICIVLVCFLSFNFVYDFILNNTAVGARLNAESLNRGVEGRYNLISEGWQFFLSSPVVGIGLGSFTTYSSSGQMSHNDYIEILSSMGLPALVIYAFIYLDYFKKCLYLNRHRYMPALFIVSTSFVIGYLFLGTGRPAFLDSVSIFIFAFYQGLISKYCNEFSKEEYYADLPYYEHARVG